MKLWSKEALILGGVYGVLTTPFTYFHNQYFEQIHFVLLGLFVIFMFLNFFNKTPSFIYTFTKQHPILSYYLISIGWIAYFLILGIIFIPLLASVLEWNDAIIKEVTDIFDIICTYGGPFSLLVAFIKRKIG